MMQKNSMVETQSLNQRNKKYMQRKKTQSQKKPQKTRTGQWYAATNAKHNTTKKKPRKVTILFQPQTLHNNRTITCNNEKRNQQNNHKHNNSTIPSI